MDDQTVAVIWQNRLARDFPEGAVCTWHRPGESPVIYLAPKLEVTGAEGHDPLVQMVTLDMSRVLGPLRVTSYEPAPAPWPPGTRRVTFGNEADAMFWNPQVPPVLKNRLGEAEPEEQ